MKRAAVGRRAHRPEMLRCLYLSPNHSGWFYPPHVVFTPNAGKHLRLVWCHNAGWDCWGFGCDFPRADRRATLRACWSSLIRPHLARLCNHRRAPAPNTPPINVSLGYTNKLWRWVNLGGKPRIRHLNGMWLPVMISITPVLLPAVTCQHVYRRKKQPQIVLGLVIKNRDQTKKQCDSGGSDAEEQTGGLRLWWVGLPALWLLPTTPTSPGSTVCWALSFVMLSLFGPAVTWWCPGCSPAFNPTTSRRWICSSLY